MGISVVVRIVPLYSFASFPAVFSASLTVSTASLDWISFSLMNTLHSPGAFSSSAVDSVPSLTLAVAPFPPAIPFRMLTAPKVVPLPFNFPPPERRAGRSS